jgi:hypothetical protein
MASLISDNAFLICFPKKIDKIGDEIALIFENRINVGTDSAVMSDGLYSGGQGWAIGES